MNLPSNGTVAEQAALLVANAERIIRENRAAMAAIDKAGVKRGCNGSGRECADKKYLAPLTLHDKAQINPALRAMLRKLQATAL